MYLARCNIPRPVHRHVCLHSLEAAAWEGRSHSEAPLQPHQGVAGGGSEDDRVLVPSDMCALRYTRERGLNQSFLTPHGSGSEQNVSSNFVPG